MARQERSIARPRDVIQPPAEEQFDEQTTPPVEAETTEFPAERPPLIDGQPTVGGKPLPAGFEHAIPHANTDQGRWDTNHAKPKRTGPRVEVGRERWEQSLAARADMPWMGNDPFKEAVAAHQQEGDGFTYRILSDKVCSKRGLRGWEPVKNATGDLAKVNTMFVGRMPTHLAERRNRYYQDRGNDALEKAQEQLEVDQERAIRDAGGQGISVLRRGDRLVDSRDPDREATVGFNSVRGAAE